MCCFSGTPSEYDESSGSEEEIEEEDIPVGKDVHDLSPTSNDIESKLLHNFQLSLSSNITEDKLSHLEESLKLFGLGKKPSNQDHELKGISEGTDDYDLNSVFPDEVIPVRNKYETLTPVLQSETNYYLDNSNLDNPVIDTVNDAYDSYYSDFPERQLDAARHGSTAPFAVIPGTEHHNSELLGTAQEMFESGDDNETPIDFDVSGFSGDYDDLGDQISFNIIRGDNRLKVQPINIDISSQDKAANEDLSFSHDKVSNDGTSDNPTHSIGAGNHEKIIDSGRILVFFLFQFQGSCALYKVWKMKGSPECPTEQQISKCPEKAQAF